MVPSRVVGIPTSTSSPWYSLEVVAASRYLPKRDTQHVACADVKQSGGSLASPPFYYSSFSTITSAVCG